MDTAELEQIAKWLRAASLSSIEIECPGYSIRISVAPTGPALPQQAPARTTTATTIGAFLDRHPLRAAALAQIGANVEPGTVVGLVKNGRLLTPVIATLSGTVARILAAPGSPVDYGRPVVEIAPHPLK
jgi:acetyl-CoA carboxylase biotin carboxyl carrier protein